MPSIVFDKVDFHYSDPPHDVFEALDLRIDTSWRTGLVARNGRGKTTLLRLISGEVEPTRGHLEPIATARIFPYDPPAPEEPVQKVVRNAVAPFDAWQRSMDELIEAGTEDAIAEYGEIAARFEAAGGYDIDARIEREVVALGLSTDLPSPPVRLPEWRGTDARTDRRTVPQPRRLPPDRRAHQPPRHGRPCTAR